MANVYYNFTSQKISLDGNTPNEPSKQIQINYSDPPTINLQVNDINYALKNVYIASDNGNLGSDRRYLILQCLADINNLSSKCAYVAIPLIPAESSDTDVDNIIKVSKNIVDLTANSYINDGKGCSVDSSVSNCVTITLSPESAITFKTSSNKCYNYNELKLPQIRIQTPFAENAKLQKKKLDWIMSCDLVGEDSSGNKTVKLDPSSSTANQISLFIMVLLVLIFVYIGGPLIYKQLGLLTKLSETKKIDADGDDGGHYPINIFIGINAALIGFILGIYGLVTEGKQIYCFIGLIIGLSYFAGTSGILQYDTVGNDNHNGFKNTTAFLNYVDFLKVLMLVIILLCGIVPSLAVKNDIAIITTVCFYFVVVFGFILISKFYDFNVNLVFLGVTWWKY